jgi:replicative superfamily II helicase
MALNPIAFTEQVVSDFLRYQLTTYPLADVDLYAQLRALLQLEQTRDTPLRRGPFVSLSRPFREGATVDALVADGVFHPGMRAIVPYPSVRAHQENAIRAIRRGDATLVSTGTGSGKTEAFLYPIISRCLELKDAPPGVVAVLIYPMNALAEDQLDRLRGLLAGRGIPFGMYVGKTPDQEQQVRSTRMPAGSSAADYRARLEQLRAAGDTTPLLPHEERASREAMRAEGHQPRILLTNVKQLELLLTRGSDVGIFANAPLEFLVFDEAHTFRGAQGAETACLIRRLRTFCGRSADQVTCIATSATMADPERGPEAARDFARRFFGVDAGRVTVVGEVHDELRWNERRATPAGPPDDPAATLARLLAAVDAPDDRVASLLSACLVELGGAKLPAKGWQAALTSQLASNDLVYHLAELLTDARALASVPEALAERVGRAVPEAEILCWLALGAVTGRGNHDPLLRPVVHSFIRGVGGAVVTLSNPKKTARLWLAGEDADAELGNAFHRFPIVTCTTCGQHYYESFAKDFTLRTGTGAPAGGDRVGQATVWPPLAAENGGARLLFIDRLVVSPDEDENAWVDEDAEADDPVPEPAVEDSHSFTHRRLHPLFLCCRCGCLHATESATCLSCQASGSLAAVQVVRHKEDFEGILHSCVACQAPGRRPRGGRYREPARPVRAVSVSDVHVLAQSMVHLSPTPRRLLVFADNRQDAAFQAGWMQDHARRFRFRAYLSQQIPPHGSGKGASIGDVVHGLDDLLEADRELSRALVPEVWQVVPFDDSGTKHRDERLYYLRLQVLREIATGVKQRLGLEPWGRLRVEYAGLSTAAAFVTAWARTLSLTPEALVEGIAALLDHLRRVRALHDRTGLFEKMWNSGNREIQFGYFPAFPGGPRGLKLTRAIDDLPSRATQWIGTRPTQVRNAVASWGVPDDQVEVFLQGLWQMLTAAKLLVPVELTGWGRPLKGSAGTWQLDSGKLLLHAHRGRWRCQKCRRTTVRSGPTTSCMAWRCGGALVQELEDADDFDLRLLDSDYEMLRVAEHSAQVPHAVRDRIEGQFKGKGARLNTLVCTPTLELGVDIGDLDAVLMRNVPPTAANYWQRAGRAGRRHRMAVDVTYAQATGFDQAYFRDPLKLLSGQVEPPRFNLKNEVMIGKHVHAAVLTTLHGIAREATLERRVRMEDILRSCFPPTLRSYLFTAGGEVLPSPLDVSGLGTLIQEHRAAIQAAVTSAFHESWPVEDRASVPLAGLMRVVDAMPDALQAVLGRFNRRLEWARNELTKLAQTEARKGALDKEDKAHRQRCERVIQRLKGTFKRTRDTAQGGAQDSETMGALAREGFLPGYGLESGAIVGLAEPPPMTEGLGDFELPRAPTLALREYVPGNAIYANGFRFVPRRFQLLPDDTLRFRVLADQQVVEQVGVHSVTAPLAAQEIRAVPVCDVVMPSQSQISDEEEFRFQMPVTTFANERDAHRGGTAWRWEDLDLRFRRGVHLRMVNVGPRKEVEQTRLGFPLCLACGQSLSPFTSRKAREEFDKAHLERCTHRVEPTGFYADVEVDVLGLHAVTDRTLGFSLAEALRMGAARVLDMEIEDLQVLAVGRAGEESVDLLLYDPMPGGSGLLEQLAERWEEVRLAALELVDGCPGACGTSCVDCLQTFRNRFYHGYLDRHRASETLHAGSGPLVRVRDLPEVLPRTETTTDVPQSHLEQRFRQLLVAAGLPEPDCQHPIDLGPGFGQTIPDFFYPLEGEEGLCIYLDGMASHLHGGEVQRKKDEAIRARLLSLGYEVQSVPSFELDDKDAVVKAITRVARFLVPTERRQALKADTSWFDRARTGSPAAERSPRPRLRLVRVRADEPGAVPMMDLRAAAGAFSSGQDPEVVGYGRVERQTPRPGLFLARIGGDSMDRIVPDGAWCLWQHLGAPGVSGPAAGDNLIVRRPGGGDPELGEFTFKRFLVQDSGRALHPASTNPSHRPIPIGEDDELQGIARLVQVVTDPEEPADPSWDALFGTTVDEVHPLLQRLKLAGAPPPTAGFEWRGATGRVEGTQLELAWPAKQVGVALRGAVSEASRAALTQAGWTLFDPTVDADDLLAVLR